MGIVNGAGVVHLVEQLAGGRRARGSGPLPRSSGASTVQPMPLQKNSPWRAENATLQEFLQHSENLATQRRKNDRTVDLHERWVYRFDLNGRGERIRTSGLYVPNVALYQAKLHPDVLAAMTQVGDPT